MRPLLLLLLAACATSPSLAPAAPGYLTVTPGESPVRLAAFGLAPGDTLPYTLSWGAGARATGYQATVRASVSGWSGLPTNATASTTSYSFKAINLAAWDSVTFTAVVRSTNSRGVSKDSAFTSWKVQRGPGAPGPIIVDSSAVQVALVIRPSSARLKPPSSTCNALPVSARWPDTAMAPVPACTYDSAGVRLWAVQQWCGFFFGLDGKWRMLEDQKDKRYCQFHYDQFPALERLPGYPIARAYIGQHQFRVRLVEDGPLIRAVVSR